MSTPTPAGCLLLLCCAALSLLLLCEARSPRDDFQVRVDRLLERQNRPVVRHPPKPRLTPGWPKYNPTVGEVSGVSVSPDGHPVILHRGPRHWDAGSFNSSAHFQRVSEGPIEVDTVLTLDAHSGKVLDSWGRGLFYLPHGVTVDLRGDVWITDVALHQALKFPEGSQLPVLELGVRFEPGSDRRHMCQPTSVAVAPTIQEEVFVADGYCNSRVLEFDAYGRFVREIPHYDEFFMSLRVPHALTVLYEGDLLCIADRENMRVVCPKAGLRGIHRVQQPITIQAPDLGRVFAVVFVGDAVFAVNGVTSPRFPVRGFTMDPTSESIIDRWGSDEGLKTPHAMAVNGNDTALFISELEPPRVWRFDLIPADD